MTDIERIAAKMGDGRERTVTDVSVSLGIDLTTASACLRKLLGMSLLTECRKIDSRSPMYKKALIITMEDE